MERDCGTKNVKREVDTFLQNLLVMLQISEACEVFNFLVTLSRNRFKKFRIVKFRFSGSYKVAQSTGLIYWG